MKRTARESWEGRQIRLAESAASKGTEAYTRLLDIAETTTYPVESARIAQFLGSMVTSHSLDLTVLMGVSQRTYSLMVRCMDAYRLRMYTSWPLPDMNWQRRERLTKYWDALQGLEPSSSFAEALSAVPGASQQDKE